MITHDLYKTGDADAPDIIKAENGEVALQLCRHCGRAEAELDQPCRSYIRSGVLEAIESELRHQQRKWGKNKQQSLAGFLLILEAELQEAKDGWMKNKTGPSAPLAEIVQVVATGIACLNYYGIRGNAKATFDIPESPE
jgi:hypothetical protein